MSLAQIGDDFMNRQLNILLVDDEKISLDILKLSLEVFSFVNIVGEASNGADVIKFLQRNKIDLVLLDIEMEDISGFELARHIQSNYSNLMIIFITGHVDLALNGYEYQPIDFLVKPVNLLRLEQALTRVRDLIYNDKSKKGTQIGIHTEGGLEIINVNDILYLEKIERKVFIFSKTGEKFKLTDSLQKLETIFSEYNFFRTHQSFLIPIDKIKSIHADEFKRSYTIQLKNVKEIIPLSRDKHNELKQVLIKMGIKIW